MNVWFDVYVNHFSFNGPFNYLVLCFNGTYSNRADLRQYRIFIYRIGFKTQSAGRSLLSLQMSHCWLCHHVLYYYFDKTSNVWLSVESNLYIYRRK